MSSIRSTPRNGTGQRDVMRATSKWRSASIEDWRFPYLSLIDTMVNGLEKTEPRAQRMETPAAFVPKVWGDSPKERAERLSRGV